MLVAVVVLRGLWRRPAADVTVATLASSYVNAGNLGLPLAVYLLGDAVAVVPPLLYQLLVLAPVAFAVLDARADPPPAGHDVATRLTGPAARRAGRAAAVPRDAVLARTLRNPIIVGALVGLALAALPWRLPEVVLGPFAMIGAAAAPLALLTFGMSLAVPRTTDAQPVRRELVLVVLLRSRRPPGARGR